MFDLMRFSPFAREMVDRAGRCVGRAIRVGGDFRQIQYEINQARTYISILAQFTSARRKDAVLRDLGALRGRGRGDERWHTHCQSLIDDFERCWAKEHPIRGGTQLDSRRRKQ